MPLPKLFAEDAVVLATVILIAAVVTPVPKIGAACPTGYSFSPTTGPGACHATPQLDPTWPQRYSASLGYSVQTSCRWAVATHHDLWLGIEFKIRSAEFHLHGMENAITPPRLDGHYAAMESAGAIIGHNWHQPFYAHLDAFLSTAECGGAYTLLFRCRQGVQNG